MGLFLDAPSSLIVFGGTTASMFIRYPMSVVFTTFTVVKNAFFHSPSLRAHALAALDEGVPLHVTPAYRAVVLGQHLPQHPSVVNAATKRLYSAQPWQ